jgi:hypothetical protein
VVGAFVIVGLMLEHVPRRFLYKTKEDILPGSKYLFTCLDYAAHSGQVVTVVGALNETAPLAGC